MMTKYPLIIVLFWPLISAGQSYSSYMQKDSFITGDAFLDSVLVGIGQKSIPYSTKKSHIPDVIKSSWKYIYGERMRMTPHGAEINTNCIKKGYLRNLRFVSCLHFENISAMLYERGSNKGRQRFLMVCEKVNRRVMVYICLLSNNSDFKSMKNNIYGLPISMIDTYIFESNR